MLIDMGFSRARAELACNNIVMLDPDMALEWLENNPDVLPPLP